MLRFEGDKMIKWQHRRESRLRSQRTAAALGLSALMLAGLAPITEAAADPTLTTLYRFQGPIHADGQFPVSSSGLIRDATGVLYGTTESGGIGNQCTVAARRALSVCGITKPDAKPDQGIGGLGTVFRVAPPVMGSMAWREQVIYSFHGGADGEEPIAGLVRGEGGVLFGTTPFGGSADGTVFMLTPPLVPNGTWSENILHRFTGGPDGAFSYGGLLLDGMTGALYGTTAGGGENGNCDGCGTVYQLTPSGDGWIESIIYSLKGFDGFFPLAGLLRDRVGALWTTAESDGNYDQGSIFRLTPGQAAPPPPARGTVPDFASVTWNETTIYSFPGYLWSATPGYGAPVQVDTGEVIGTTVEGGDYRFCQNGCGTVYKMIPPAAPGSQWVYRVIHRFHGGTDGALPWAGLIKGPGGVLYGTTMGGGNGGFCGSQKRGVVAGKSPPVGPGPGCGTVYKLTPPPKGKTYWPETVLYRFKGRGDGSQPLGALLRGPQGELFGTTSMGGLGCPQVQGCGTVFMLQP
ncbi:MAG: choice-of-anchor tandem repeat GloVer-containing protein [Opitutales bacterium]